MDFNFADLKKEAAATAEDVFSHTADVAKQATNATYDLLSGGGGRASTGAQDDNSHTEHYFANEQKGIDFEQVDPQAFVQRMSAGAKEAQEQLDAKFAQHDFDDFLTNASKDLHSFGSQLQHDTKQGVHDFMNAERGLFSGAGDINKQTVEVSAPTAVPVTPNKPAEDAVKEADLLNFSVGDAAEKHAPLQPFEEDFEIHFAPTAPASTTTTLYDDDLEIGKSFNSASVSNKDSDTDSPSLSCNPSPAKKNPVTAALKEQDNDKFISSEDLLGDFKDERTSTPDFQVKPKVTKPAAEVETATASVPITDLDAEEEATSLLSQPKHSQIEEIKEADNTNKATSSATLPVASATAAAAPKPAAVSEPFAAKPLASTTTYNKDTTEVVKPKTAPPVPPKESKPSHQHLDQPKIVSVEEIFYKYGLDAWFKPERLHPRVESLIYWRDVKKSGIFFGAGLVTLLAISCFSVISVFAYLSLLTLAGTVAFRIYKSVMQAIQKTPEGHPFKEYLDIDLTLSQEKVQNIAGVAVAHVNGFVAELRRLFLVEDLVDSIKFGVILWVLTYIGGWFNGMTLVILAFVSLFTLPKVYENNKQSIDTYLDLVRSKLTEITEKIKAAIPIGKKPIAAESDKDK
ncbi:reticulon-2 isoform X2 [Bactrocera oleae]|uniref:reticulon-2 isoform X2 n=1 Tax=Bactrocera oleae TaxID=104688 RepID=UPI0006B75C59|nr:reticulon-4 isoform X1 [Bactrocera oleae]XP_036230972.1 reticulon-4 isoform X1 [Bactrocera oleae]XP_036230975.1 reticulon-4 isoform X1 [Bactrocera oleae]